MPRVSAKVRKKTATVVINGKPKYPINDKKHAELAVARIDQAKPPLDGVQKAKVRRRASQFGVGTAKKGTKGS